MIVFISNKAAAWLRQALTFISSFAYKTFFNFPYPVWPTLSLFQPFILFGLHIRHPAL